MKGLWLAQLVLIIPSLSFSEVIQEGKYSLEPNAYIVEGETKGCGLIFHALNIEGTLLSGSVNVFYSKQKGLFSALKLEAYKKSFLGQKLAPKEMKVNYGWVKTGKGTMFEGKVVPGGEKFLSMSVDFDHFMKVFSELLLGNLTLGFNESHGAFDKVFILTNPPSNDSIKRVAECMDDFVKNIEAKSK